VPIKSRTDVAKRHEAAQQQCRANQQDHRKGRLTRDQDATNFGSSYGGPAAVAKS
jgi:hypothetical protein